MPINYTNYLKACKKASEDEVVFMNFRRDSYYNVVIEHNSYRFSQFGLDYLMEVKKNTPDLLKYVYKFATSENIGNPIVYYYDIIGCYLSPTTCRYIKVLSDLIIYFKNLEIDIVEIGGGYGGQCKIIYDYIKPKSYTIIDLPDSLALAKKYLDCFDIEVNLKNASDPFGIDYDLCISNYSFSEFDRKYQDFYAEKIIKNSKNGYMTCNFMGLSTIDGAFSTEELKALKQNSKILPEIPKTADRNLIYIWNHTAR